MMKKIIPVIVTVLIICLSVPSVPAFAAADGLNRFVTSELVNENGDLLQYCTPSFSYSENYYSFDMEKFNNFSNLPLNPIEDDCVYVLSGNPSGTMYLTMFDMSEYAGTYQAVMLYRNANYMLAIRTSNPVYNRPFMGYTWQYNVSSETWTQAYNSGSFTFTRGADYNFVDNGNGSYSFLATPEPYTGAYYFYSSSVLGTTLYTNADGWFSFYQFSAAGNTISGTDYFTYALFNGGNSIGGPSMDNYLSFGYYNGSDYVEDGEGGAGEESNLNHLYFNSADVGFCEPSGVSSYSSFGGAYFYVKYNVDNWIKTHINDYDLYFSATGFVGNRQYNGSVRLSLDPDGCICIPFSNIFTTDGGLVSNGFIAATTNKQVEQNFYKSYLYSVSSDKLPALLDKFNNVSDNSMSGAWDKLLDVTFGNWLFAYTQTGATNVISNTTLSLVQDMVQYYSNYKIQVNFYLVDNGDNRSGSIGRMFDLALGSDTSTDNQGLQNENPYVPTDEDLQDDDFLPVVPPDYQTVVTTGSGGVNVYNMTPSEIELTIQDGLDRFVSWYNTTPDTQLVQNRFWDSMGIFKGNPASELYEDYWGFLPDNFKNVILGCATIGIIGGACTILRKRLMK